MSEMATKRSILEIVKSNGKVALPRRAGQENSQPQPERDKLARLLEARRLMLSTMMDAGAASLRVARLRQESRLWA